MTGRPAIAPVQPVALDRERAAAALSMSLDSFERYVQPHIRMLRFGKMRLVPVAELKAFCEKHAERPLAEARRAA